MRWIDAAEAIVEAKSNGYRIFGLAIDDDAVPVSEVEWSFPAAIVLGEEKTGMPPDVEKLCDVKIAIPLFGMVTSINAGQAAAIAVNAAVSAYRAKNRDFEPVRNASRRLLGLTEVNYQQSSADQRETTESDG